MSISQAVLNSESPERKSHTEILGRWHTISFPKAIRFTVITRVFSVVIRFRRMVWHVTYLWPITIWIHKMSEVDPEVGGCNYPTVPTRKVGCLSFIFQTFH